MRSSPRPPEAEYRPVRVAKEGSPYNTALEVEIEESIRSSLRRLASPATQSLAHCQLRNGSRKYATRQCPPARISARACLADGLKAVTDAAGAEANGAGRPRSVL